MNKMDKIGKIGQNWTKLYHAKKIIITDSAIHAIQTLVAGRFINTPTEKCPTRKASNASIMHMVWSHVSTNRARQKRRSGTTGPTSTANLVEDWS